LGETQRKHWKASESYQRAQRLSCSRERDFLLLRQELTFFFQRKLLTANC